MTEEQNSADLDEDVVEDVEIYEDEPDTDGEHGVQDDEAPDA